MTIRVARGVSTQIREYTGDFVIQVQQASDPAAAARALALAADDIWALDGGWQSIDGSPQDRNNPKYVSQVMPAATGPFIIVDGGSVPFKLLYTIPEIVGRRLAEAGVTDAVVAAPKGGGGPLLEWATKEDPWVFIPGLVDLPRAVLRLYPLPMPLEATRPPRYATMPDVWLDEAAAWARSDLGPDRELMAAIEGVEFTLPAHAGRDLLAQARAARSVCTLGSGDAEAALRIAKADFIWFVPSLALYGDGPGAEEADLLATIEALKSVARRLGPTLAYSYLAVLPSSAGAEVPPQDYSPEGNWTFLMDELVNDGYHYQVLGSGHLARLGGMPPGARELGGGRVEVTVGEPDDWLFDDFPRPASRLGDFSQYRRDTHVRRRAQELLAPCLPRPAEVDEILRLRWEG